jgi:membrane-bound ClpP family serine protease
MNWVTIAILIITGLALIAVDFYLPGFVLGSIGVVLMLVALVLTYKSYGTNVMLVLFLLELTVGIGVGYASIKLFPQTAVGKRMILGETQTGVRAESPKQLDEWLGREGVAQTVLRPAGVAIIDGKRLDVEAESGMIEGGSPIKVVAVHDNRLVVKKLS